jgi:hypothetical protein
MFAGVSYILCLKRSLPYYYYLLLITYYLLLITYYLLLITYYLLLITYYLLLTEVARYVRSEVPTSLGSKTLIIGNYLVIIDLLFIIRIIYY